MQKRNEVDEKYKWDIGLFKDKKDVEKAFEDINFLTEELPKYYGKLTDKETFFKFMLSYKDKEMNIQKFIYYVFNTLETDNADVEMLKLSSRLDVALTKFNQAEAPLKAQIEDLDEAYLKSLLLDPRSKDINNMIEDVIKSKPHKLDEKSTVLLSKISNALVDTQNVYDIFTTSELKFDDIKDSLGNTHKFDEASYSKFLFSKDDILRKNAYLTLLNGYSKFNKTLAELYLQDVKALNDFIKLKNYKSALQNALFEEDVPQVVFENNLKCVKNNTKLMRDYIKIYAKHKNFKDVAIYDLSVDDSNFGEISIEQGQKIMLEALAPLGQDYINKVKYKLSDKSIDYMPNQNKNSGAYNTHCYGAKSLILTNWTNNFYSVSTLAHEMGHCINAEYFCETQPMEKAEITTFSAEIASTLNELLLTEYMLKTSNKEEKIAHLQKFFRTVRSSIFRQTMFSEFELYVHSSIEQEKPLTYQDLNDKYMEIVKDYFGTSCIIPECTKFEWSRIPHFYRHYYVYSYSTGLITAIALVTRILKDKNYVNNYIRFLKNGTDKKAVEILKEIGVDLTTTTPFDEAFAYIKEKLEEYKELTK